MKKIFLAAILFAPLCLLHGQNILSLENLEKAISSFEEHKQNYILSTQYKSSTAVELLKYDKKANNIKGGVMVASGAALIGIGAGLFVPANEAYINYKAAEATKEAIYYREKTVALDVIKGLFIASGAIVGISSAYYFAKPASAAEIARQELFKENIKELFFAR